MQKIELYSADSEELTWEISEIAGNFHVTCLDQSSGLAGSGFASLKETSKKIAFSELNERYLVGQLRIDPLEKENWGLNFDESCSGFAVGYVRSKAIIRALCEAAERWVLSQWVDNRQALPELSLMNPSPVATSIQAHFSECSGYSVEVPVLIEENLIKVQTVVILGWTEKGVFAGYGSKISVAEAIDHAYIEAMRNFIIYKNQSPRDLFPYNRIKYFAENKESAIETLNLTQAYSPTIPRLKMLKVEPFGELWLARAIFDGWAPWQEGPISRFLY